MLQHLVDHPEINRIVEIGFGDFNVTGEIRLKKNKTYIGYDVVDSINRLDNKNEFFKIIHSIEDLEFVEGDLLITKDVIMHWPLAKVHYFFEKIVPNFKYSFVVNDHTENETILDINYGQWRPLNIRLYTDLPREEVYARSISFYVKRGYIFPNRPCAKL